VSLAPRSWSFLSFIVIGVVAFHAHALWSQEPASAPASRGAAESLSARLRAGPWVLEDLQTLVAILVSEKRMLAAEWWAAAAEDALKKGDLPPGARAAVAETRRKLDQANKPPVEARLAWTQAGEHFRAMVDRKAAREAAVVLTLLEQLAAAWPEVAWRRDVVALRQRLAKLGPPLPDEAVKDKDRKATADLASRVRIEVARRSDGAVEEFRRFGCRQGFAQVDALLRGRQPDDAFAADLKTFRAAARSFGMAKDLTVHILAPVRIIVHQDGSVVPLGTTPADPSYDASQWREVRLRVLPGEVVAFELKIPDSAPTFVLKDRREVRYAELFLAAARDGKALKREAWQVGTKDQIRMPKPRVGGILFADIGPNTSITVDGKIPVCMNYAEANARRDEAIVIDAGMTQEEMVDVLFSSIVSDLLSPALIRYDEAHKDIEKKVQGEKAGFAWATTAVENPVYFLMLPR
jgi:hypothetical protein